MKRQNRTKDKGIMPWLLAIWLLGPATAQADDYAIDDAYLQSLSAEADQLEYMSGAEAELKASREAESAPVSPESLERLQQALRDTGAFEQVLNAHYPYSYQLYRKLNMQDRQRAFDTLRTSRRFSEVKHMIIQAYRQQIGRP
ncbi:MAG TPA: hypothetical protein ENK53_03465 [Thiotrichales bacterium]|nr:hypothetical protein [Thiotrichales bacterium]